MCILLASTHLYAYLHIPPTLSLHIHPLHSHTQKSVWDAFLDVLFLCTLMGFYQNQWGELKLLALWEWFFYMTLKLSCSERTHVHAWQRRVLPCAQLFHFIFFSLLLQTVTVHIITYEISGRRYSEWSNMIKIWDSVNIISIQSKGDLKSFRLHVYLREF